MNKTLAKALANRLKECLSDLIAENQYFFIKDRHIMDGILIANEPWTVNYNLENQGCCSKADFEKAYNHVILYFISWVLN